jgi:hypothetical protein
MARLAEVKKGFIARHLVFLEVPDLGEERIDHLFLQVDGLLVGIDKDVDDLGHPVQIEQRVGDDYHKDENDQKITDRYPPEDAQATRESEFGHDNLPCPMYHLQGGIFNP